MKGVRFGLAVIAVITMFSALRVVGVACGGQQGTQPGTFRLTVTKVLDEEDVIVAQIEVEAMPGC